jgi:hypothetical protein
MADTRPARRKTLLPIFLVVMPNDGEELLLTMLTISKGIWDSISSALLLSLPLARD